MKFYAPAKLTTQFLITLTDTAYTISANGIKVVPAMASTFPFMRLPYEPQVKILKIHVQPFNVAVTTPYWRRGHDPIAPATVIALPIEKSCVMHLCKSLQEAGMEAILACFTGTVKVNSRYMVSWTFLLQRFDEEIVKYLPATLPCGRVTDLNILCDGIQEMDPLRDYGHSWDDLSDSLRSNNMLMNLSTIEITYSAAAEIFKRARSLAGGTYTNGSELFALGQMDQPLLDMLGTSFPRSASTSSHQIRRTNGKSLDLYLNIMFNNLSWAQSSLIGFKMRLLIKSPAEVDVMSRKMSRNVITADGVVFREYECDR